MNIFQTWHSSMQMMGRVSGEQRRQSRRISLTCNQVAEQVPRSDVDKVWTLLSRNIFRQFKFHKSGSPTIQEGRGAWLYCFMNGVMNTSLAAMNSTEQITSWGCFSNSAMKSPGSNCRDDDNGYGDKLLCLDRMNLTSHHSSDAKSEALLLDFFSDRCQWYHQHCSGTCGTAWKLWLIRPAIINGGAFKPLNHVRVELHIRILLMALPGGKRRLVIRGPIVLP